MRLSPFRVRVSNVRESIVGCQLSGSQSNPPSGIVIIIKVLFVLGANFGCFIEACHVALILACLRYIDFVLCQHHSLGPPFFSGVYTAKPERPSSAEDASEASSVIHMARPEGTCYY